MPDPISWSYTGPYLFAALAIGYLIGSIPFGFIFTRLGGGGDIRKTGSGNIGATNVLRTGRKDLAAATLAADLLKGFAAVVIAFRFGIDPAVSAGLGVFLGHLFPVWLKFKGGKGVATYLGALAGFYWPAALAFAVIWLAIAFLTRYSSLSALLAALATPVVLWFADLGQLVELFGLMTLLMFLTHRGNIMRLVRGAEPKIGATGSGT